MPNYRNGNIRTFRNDVNYHGRNNYDGISRGGRHNERARGGTTRAQHNGRTNTSQDLENMVETVLKRILEQRDDPHTNGNLELRDSTLHHTHQQRATAMTSNGTNRSENPEFQTMWKSLYKVIQIQHHLDNWSDLPKSIRRDLTHLGKDIRPPDPVDGLDWLMTYRKYSPTLATSYRNEYILTFKPD